MILLLRPRQIRQPRRNHMAGPTTTQCSGHRHHHPRSVVPPRSSKARRCLADPGLIGITFGWICGGPFFALFALILGVVALFQIKKDPVRYGGKPMALIGSIRRGSISDLCRDCGNLDHHDVRWCCFVIALSLSGFWNCYETLSDM